MIHKLGTCLYFIDLFVTRNILITGTVISRIVHMTLYLLLVIYSGSTHSSHSSQHICTILMIMWNLRFMLYNENDIKPWSSEYILLKHLTKSF